MATTRLVWMLVTTIACTHPVVAQDKDKTKDDILQSRNGDLLVGKILSLSDSGVEMQLKTGGKVTLLFKDLHPYSVYRLKAERIEAGNAQAHFELGEWCLAGGYYAGAVTEFDLAAALDKNLEEKAKKRREEAVNEQARVKFEDARRLIAAKDYDEAVRLLSELVTVHKDTPWAKEAQSEMAKATEEIKKDVESKKKALEDKLKQKADATVKSKEDAEKAGFQQTVDLLEESRRAWGEGLEWEGKGNLTKADRAWQVAEGRLLQAKRNTEQLVKSNDVDILKQGRELDKETDAWLVKTYYRLGSLWALELNYPDALKWLNRGLKIAPDDSLLNETLLTLRQIEMRRRSGVTNH